MTWLMLSLCAACQAAPGAADEAILEARGFIVAAHPVQVSPCVPGKVVWVNSRLEEGQSFKEGEVLAKIEDTPYRCDHDHALAAYQAAQARFKETLSSATEEIKQAEADLAGARAVHEEAEKQASRIAQLRDMKAVSEEDAGAAAAAAEAAKRKVAQYEAALEGLKKGRRKDRQDAAEAETAMAKADLDKAKWRLACCEIRAPISGTVLVVRAHQGDAVDAAAFGVATSLCDMANLADLEVDVKIAENDIGLVRAGQACTIMPEAYRKDDAFLKSHPGGYKGKVSRVLPTADKTQGAFQVRVRVDVPPEEVGDFLRIDMGVVVSFKKHAKP